MNLNYPVLPIDIQAPVQAVKSVFDRILDSLFRLSADYGSGQPIRDLLIFPVLLTVVFAVVAAVMLLGRGKRGQQADAMRNDALAGKLERTERSLNEFRTQATRDITLLRGEVRTLRGEVEKMQDALAGVSERNSEREYGGGLLESDRDVESSYEEPRSADSEEPQYSADESGNDMPAPAKAESLATRLSKTRLNLFEKIRSVFAVKPKIDDETVDELEVILVGSDIGLKTASALLAELKEDVKNGADVRESGFTALLKLKLVQVLEQGSHITPVVGPRRTDDGPYIVLIVGVNGVGKTTTVAKLANRWKREGSSVLMVAADTFRAAAVEQLHEWGRRLQCPVVSGAQDAKPQTVIYDALVRAKEEAEDVVIIDTAGRLHNKANLMEELTGIHNAIKRHFEYGPNEVWLVVDGSTGQNAITQAKEFNEVTKLTGLIVTKLDGTSRGGVVVGIKEALGIPVRFIGVGEGAEDLRPFIPRDFVEAIFATPEEAAAQRGGISLNAEVRRRRRAEGM